MPQTHSLRSSNSEECRHDYSLVTSHLLYRCSFVVERWNVCICFPKFPAYLHQKSTRDKEERHAQEQRDQGARASVCKTYFLSRMCLHQNRPALDALVRFSAFPRVGQISQTHKQAWGGGGANCLCVYRIQNSYAFTMRA